MKSLLLPIFIVFSSVVSWGQSNQIHAINTEELQKRISNEDTVYVINYWSTTCIPCIRELPYFERLQEQYKNKPVKVLLLSFDFPEDYPQKLNNWVTKKKLNNEVIWFKEQKPNDYIPKLNPDWEGSLPATTIIYKKKNSYWFKEGIVSEGELALKVEEILN